MIRTFENCLEFSQFLLENPSLYTNSDLKFLAGTKKAIDDACCNRTKRSLIRTLNSAYEKTVLSINPEELSSIKSQFNFEKLKFLKDGLLLIEI